MVRQTVFLSLALLAGLVIGIGVGYLANINQVNSLNYENADLRFQVFTLQQNLTACNSSYQTLQSLYTNLRNSYQSLSIQNTNLNLELNSAYANLRSLNRSVTLLSYQYRLLEAAHADLLRGTYNATFLIGGAYAAQLLSALAAANSSICITMREMEYDPLATNSTSNALIGALAVAKSRGVDVRVIIDEYTQQQYPDTLDYLAAGGVPVRLDHPNSAATNTNIVVIDGQVAYIGDGGWTEETFTASNGLWVELRGNMTAAVAHFNDLWGSSNIP